ncbi:FAD-dependent oxidoreductase (plasmid) [Pseudoalteromonas xiamenensis]|uniref:NAD(P)/FAD-dependent oxidoreductase n=1 Tax=Pseudoalteromonas xiamenensis TaxID=882626 RepID=UPI0027E5B31C|nr:FAD-dependent oxidoreductase [Pseudoalteromonas xiamenensis]WMN62141.1 FAD-dependent oxidoreductase [Pseudoalteromonas xiamenensis]
MKKIAIIGSGISGMTAAHCLREKYDVTLFEKNEYIGGHTATIDVEWKGESVAVDTGFIVYNDRTYPLFRKLMKRIGIEGQETQMSFSVRNMESGLEYNGHTFATLFAQKRNLLSPKFWKLLKDIIRFNTLCKEMYSTDEFGGMSTLGELLDKHRFNDFFQRHYILPMGAAIWSTSLNAMAKFELAFFIRFFYNHGLLDITNRPQWYVIPGGSKQYIEPLLGELKNKVELNSTIEAVTRTNEGVKLTFVNGVVRSFDHVVFACHSDEALNLLGDPTQEEKSILQGIPYTKNSVVLHTDIGMLPKRKKAWASWNYQLSPDLDAPASVTYQMNILQGLKTKEQFCVTLNGESAIDKSKIIRTFSYSHPVFNKQSLLAQSRRSEINGQQNTFYCGAYWYNGFHEDGVRSAVDVALLLGVDFE